MRAGAMPGGDAVCHGHHVWDEGECLRCGLLDLSYHDNHESGERQMRCPGCDCEPVGYAPHNGKGDCPPNTTNRRER